jgi:O-antigen/teichoic acid export membrane protein
VNTALLGRFVGIAPLGAYRFGWRFATQAVIPVASAATYVLFPAFARISHDSNRFQAAFLRAARLLAVLVLPISLALPPLGEQIAVALLGDRWRAAGHALAALAGVAAALPVMALATEVFKAANRPDLLPRMSLGLGLATVVLIIAFLPLGVAGVAGGMSIAYVLTAGYALRNVARVLALPVWAVVAEMLRPAVASIGMAATLALFVALVAEVDGEPTLVRLGWLAAEIVLGVLVYAALLLRLAPSSVAEVTSALRNLRPRKPSNDGTSPMVLAQGSAAEREQKPIIP